MTCGFPTAETPATELAATLPVDAAAGSLGGRAILGLNLETGRGKLIGARPYATTSVVISG